MRFYVQESVERKKKREEERDRMSERERYSEGEGKESIEFITCLTPTVIVDAYLMWNFVFHSNNLMTFVMGECKCGTENKYNGNNLFNLFTLRYGISSYL